MPDDKKKKVVPTNVKPLYIADPKEYAFRNQMYNDSLNLYNATKDNHPERIGRQLNNKISNEKIWRKESEMLPSNTIESWKRLGPSRSKPIKETFEGRTYNRYKEPTQPVTNKKLEEEVIPNTEVSIQPVQEITQQLLNNIPQQTPVQQPIDNTKYAYRTQWSKDETGKLINKQTPYSKLNPETNLWELIEDREPGYIDNNETRATFKNGGQMKKPKNIPTWNYPSKGTPIFRDTTAIPNFKYGGNMYDFGGNIGAGISGIAQGVAGSLLPGPLGSMAVKGIQAIHGGLDKNMSEQEKGIAGFGRAAGAGATAIATGGASLSTGFDDITGGLATGIGGFNGKGDDKALNMVGQAAGFIGGGITEGAGSEGGMLGVKGLVNKYDPNGSGYKDWEGYKTSLNEDWKNTMKYGGNMYPMGGQMQQGMENQLTQFNEGGSHEENPQGGIPQGMGTNGQPNLVEQGETKLNSKDYVYSDSLKIDKDLVEGLNLPKKFIGKTFAEASKLIDRPNSRRENDTIENVAKSKELDVLMNAQEQFKAVEFQKQMALMQSQFPEQLATLQGQFAGQGQMQNPQEEMTQDPNAEMMQQDPNAQAMVDPMMQQQMGVGQMMRNGGNLFAPGGYLDGVDPRNIYLPNLDRSNLPLEAQFLDTRFLEIPNNFMQTPKSFDELNQVDNIPDGYRADIFVPNGIRKAVYPSDNLNLSKNLKDKWIKAHSDYDTGKISESQVDEFLKDFEVLHDEDIYKGKKEYIDNMSFGTGSRPETEEEKLSREETEKQKQDLIYQNNFRDNLGNASNAYDNTPEQLAEIKRKLDSGELTMDEEGNYFDVNGNTVNVNGKVPVELSEEDLQAMEAGNEDNKENPGYVWNEETNSWMKINEQKDLGKQTFNQTPLNAAASLAPVAFNTGMGIATMFQKPAKLSYEDYMNKSSITAPKMNIDPQLRAAEQEFAAGQKGLKNIGGAAYLRSIGSLANQGAMTRAGLYANKENADNQAKLQADTFNAQLAGQNANSRFQVDDWNARSKTAKQQQIADYLGAATNQIGQLAQADTGNKLGMMYAKMGNEDVANGFQFNNYELPWLKSKTKETPKDKTKE
jgi:hypothetical protein